VKEFDTSVSSLSSNRNVSQFGWDYRTGDRPQVDALYEQGKRSQWNGMVDLAWNTVVEPEQLASVSQALRPYSVACDHQLARTSVGRWSGADWIRFGIEYQNWTLSQFLHGEQGALLCSAKIVETVPWLDAKLYAATQVIDEARHVEVFHRYLNEKLSGYYPVNGDLLALLDDIVTDSRWDITYLGMQILVEGLALAAFGLIRRLTQEPLLKSLLRYVMKDEARHVAFGVLCLREFYLGLSAAELRDRQEFVFGALVRIQRQLTMPEVWERLGVPRLELSTVTSVMLPEQAAFEALLFLKIVPNLGKLGLLDAAGGWLRRKCAELGATSLEDFGRGGADW
jgi:hypothetical protein